MGNFTQDELTVKAAAERAEGERAVTRKYTEGLGAPIEEVKARLKAAQEREDADKSEQQKALDEIEALKKSQDGLKQAKDSEISQAQAERHSDRRKVRLLLASVPLPEDTSKKVEALDDLAGFLRVPDGDADVLPVA